MKIKLLRSLIFMSKLFFGGLLIQTALFSVLFASNGKAQQAQSAHEVIISVKLEDASLKEVFSTIEGKTKFKFSYDKKDLNHQIKINLKSNKESVADILMEVSRLTRLKFKQVNNNIHATSIQKLTADAYKFEEEISPPIKVSGQVTSTSDETGLPGVNVLIKGSSVGTVTDFNGNYTLSVPNANDTLIFSSIGFTSEEVPVNGQAIINIALTEDIQSLSEVVVVGYGTQKKISTTAAVSSVKGEVLQESPVANISNSIAGRVAGVSMRPDGGQPGSDSPDIHIRGIGTTGNNQPLIVVDGIIRDNINQIDQNTIESVSVLKDAAAVAPYGLGGANGVILITTKKGSKGAPTLSFNSYYGLQRPTYFPDMLNAKDYMRLHNEAYLNENPNGDQLPYSTDLINNYDQLHAQNPDRYPASNASREIVNMTSPMENYDLQLSGGSDNIQYYAGIGYFNQKGMFDPVNYRRYSYNVRLDVQASKTTKVSASLIGAIERTKSVDAEVTTGRLFRSGYKFVPTANLYYSNGLWGEFAGNSPIGILNAGYLRDNNNTLLTTLAIEQELPFIKGLSVKGTFSYDPNQQIIKSWHTPYYFYSQDTTTTPYTYTEQISTSEGSAATYTWLSQEYLQNETFTYQAYLNYQNTFGKHTITGLVVAEARNNDSTMFSARRNNFAINVDELNMGSSNKNDFDNGGMSSTGSQIGFVYRLGYNFSDKYLLEASGRYDGHYYFAPGKRWGYFPAFSVGWVLSEESMIQNVSFINYLKIRGSWGKSGNLAGTAFQYVNGYNLYGNAYAYGNGNMVQGSFIPNEANPNITWEVSKKTDIGFEATIFDGLLNIEADYFHERRTGMLLPPAVSVPVEYGLDLPDENAGIMSNSGIELSLTTSHDFSNGLRLDFNGNFSYAKNKMLQVFETSATRNNPNRSRTGRALGTTFGYQSQGLFTTEDDTNGDGIINSADGYNVVQFGELHPGDIRYADLSGPEGVPDGKIDSNDETVIGYPNYPAISYGFTPSATWKGFDLSLFFQGAAMASINIQGFQTVPFNNNNSNSSYEYYNNRWTPENQDARYPKANQSPYANNTQTSDFWMLNTSYLRLKTGMLGYTIPSQITQSINIQRVRVYFTGQNLLTLSKLDFMDPEVGYTDVETAYPNQKAYIFGLNVTF